MTTKITSAVPLAKRRRHGSSADDDDSSNNNNNNNNNNTSWNNVSPLPRGIYLAPMVRGSELAMRMLSRNCSHHTGSNDGDDNDVTVLDTDGASLCYGPMLRDEEVLQVHALWQRQQRQQQQQQQQQQQSSALTNNHSSSSTSSQTKIGHGAVVRMDKAGRTLDSVEETAYLLLTDRYDEHDTPNLVVQLCGSDPSTMGEATTAVLDLYAKARDIENGNNHREGGGKHQPSLWPRRLPAGIDFNLGCPQACASQGNFGAFLVERDTDAAVKCVAAMRSAIDTYFETNYKTDRRCHSDDHHHHHHHSHDNHRPRLSAKLRLLERTDETIAFCRKLQQAGCDHLAVHCRRRTAKHDGPPDWDAGQQIVDALQNRIPRGIPIVLNGGIRDRKDAVQVMERTGCHAVMVAHGYLENHSRFRCTKDISNNDDAASQMIIPSQVAALAAEYLDSASQYPPPSYLYVQKHLRWIFRSTLEQKTAATTNVENHVTPAKVDYTDWRVQLWGFLVRPYLRTIHQFRLVAALYCKFAHVPDTEIPYSIHYLVKDVSFKSIKNAGKAGDQ